MLAANWISDDALAAWIGPDTSDDTLCELAHAIAWECKDPEDAPTDGADLFPLVARMARLRDRLIEAGHLLAA